MILDDQLAFSTDQTVTTGSDSGVLSENVIDLRAASLDLGSGEPLYILVVVETAMEGAGDTLDVEVVSDSVATLDSSLSVHQVIGTFAAQSAVGTRLLRPFPTLDNTLERYLGLRYFARGSGALTAGVFSAYLLKDPHAFYAYPDGFTIS